MPASAPLCNPEPGPQVGRSFSDKSSSLHRPSMPRRASCLHGVWLPHLAPPLLVTVKPLFSPHPKFFLGSFAAYIPTLGISKCQDVYSLEWEEVTMQWVISSTNL